MWEFYIVVQADISNLVCLANRKQLKHYKCWTYTSEFLLNTC